jgi:uncharacterized protein (TIGR03435 family)
MEPRHGSNRAGSLTLAGVILISVGNAPAIRAQSLSASPLTFDAVSIRPTNLPPGGREGIRGGSLRYTQGRVVGRNVSAWRMILEAYHVPQYQLSGGPGWLESDRFSIEAKTESPADENQLRLMLRTLLGQRFKLVVRREVREMSTYAMVVGKGGPRLLEIKEGEPTPSRADLVSRGVALPEMDHVAGVLADRGNMQSMIDRLNEMGKFDRPVVDKTGLRGEYFFAFQWDAEENFMAELQEQSGLKFVSQKLPVDVIIVDHVEKPAAN